jgi:hypothetical protein
MVDTGRRLGEGCSVTPEKEVHMHGRVTQRRVALIGVAALALVAFAMPANAGASFTTHFSVISEDVRFHDIPNGFAGRTVLLNPANLDNRVGHSKIRCVFVERNRKARCRLLLHLDGTIGGFGNLLVKGNFGRGDRTMNVVDGDGDFSGRIAGKVFVHTPSQPTNQLDFALTR